MLTVNLFSPAAGPKNSRQNCMAVVLTGCHVKVYTSDGTLLQKLAFVAPDFANSPLKNFLQHIDNTLDLFLHFYPLPVFIFGNDVSINHFKSITSHGKNISNFFSGCYGSISEDAINCMLRTSLNSHL